MRRLTLFSTSGCHLCEEAHVLIAFCLKDRLRFTDALEIVDIGDDPALMDRYGIRIPVLRNPESGRELDWPFGAEDIQDLL